MGLIQYNKEFMHSMFTFSILVMSWVTEYPINLLMNMKRYTMNDRPLTSQPRRQIFIALPISLNVTAVIIKATMEMLIKNNQPVDF